MKITFLDNGIDSLQKGFQSFLDYENRTINSEPSLDDYFVLKQAVLSTHHGVEILMKYILYMKSEFLIVDKIDSKFMRAYSEKEKQGKSSVFETSHADEVYTITYKEALERIKEISNVKVSSSFADRLNKIERIRNALTHSEIDFPDEEIVDIFSLLLDELDVFFFKSIGNEYTTLSGYDSLQKNYEEYMRILTEKDRIVKKNAFEAFTASLKNASILCGINEVKRLQDISQAKKFIVSLNKYELSFGIDLYNGWCSGKTTIKIVDDTHMSFVCPDNNGEYVFKFKSLLVCMPAAVDQMSPILIFESDVDTTPLDKLSPDVRTSYSDQEYIETFIFEEDGREIFDYSEIAENHEREDYEDGYVAPKYKNMAYFMIGRTIAALNVQGLNYWNFHKLLRNTEEFNGHQLEIILRDFIKR